MLRGETNTGVTLQTLHPTEFDAGVVLDQTEEPGIPIPNPGAYSYADLQKMSSAMAAEMLIKAVRNRSFVPPFEDVRKTRGTSTTRHPSFAPKIEARMRYIDFETMTSSQILRMNRAIGPLLAEARPGNDDSTTSVIFPPTMCLADMAGSHANDTMAVRSIAPGLPYVLLNEQINIGMTSTPLMINTVDKQALIVPTLKMPGTKYRHAAALAHTARLLAEPSQRHSKRVRTFYEPLKVPDDFRQYVKSLWIAADNTT
jgi:methionyl-tRNA formyltransferase